MVASQIASTLAAERACTGDFRGSSCGCILFGKCELLVPTLLHLTIHEQANEF
jgi:hypothetical protein